MQSVLELFVFCVRAVIWGCWTLSQFVVLMEINLYSLDMLDVDIVNKSN